MAVPVEANGAATAAVVVAPARQQVLRLRPDLLCSHRSTSATDASYSSATAHVGQLYVVLS